MSNPISTRSLRAGAASAEQFADGALDSTGQFAAQAIEKAGGKAHELRLGMQDLAARGMSGVADASASAQKQVGRYAGATRRYVSEQPVKSALIAAAVGAGVAALVIAGRRHRDD